MITYDENNSFHRYFNLIIEIQLSNYSITPRSYLEKIMFVSGNNASIQHPLIYKHPIRHDDTIMLALGSLSGRYMLINPDESKSELSEEETQLIQGNYNQL